MIAKTTAELMDELMKANNIGEYLKQNSHYMVSEELSAYLSNILEKKGLVKSAVIKKTEMSEVMGYQIFSGVRNPSRDSLICLCSAMELSVEETQSLIQIGGFALLYPKNKRDAIIINGIDSNLTVARINENLYDNGENTLNQ